MDDQGHHMGHHKSYVRNYEVQLNAEDYNTRLWVGLTWQELNRGLSIRLIQHIVCQKLMLRKRTSRK